MLLTEKTIDSPDASLQNKDQHLIAELQVKDEAAGRFASEATGLLFANKELAKYSETDYTASKLREIEDLLAAEGTLDIPVIDGFNVTVGGVEQPVSIVAATETAANHGDMSSMLYLRDHIQAARTLMELFIHNPHRYQKEGETAKTLLMSALHLMSTDAQLARFKDVIARGNEAGQEDWPHISLYFNDLEGNNANGWRNKQDTFQMLAHLTFEAIENGFITTTDLLDSHKQFLGSIVPLLKSVGFPRYENSGSWEEVAANRTSVMAVETALLHKMQALIADGHDLTFLEATYNQTGDGQFKDMLASLYHNGLAEIGKRLPDESPDYDQTSVKYRTNDAALVYVLMYDLPKLLADESVPVGHAHPQVLSREAIENVVLTQLSHLTDTATGGIIRYEDDSYQRVNFHTNEVQQVIAAIKRQIKTAAQQSGTEIDLDEKQRLRNELTPQGKPAAWTHPLGQLSSWAARRMLETQQSKGGEADAYRELSVAYLNRCLAMVTGENQWNAVLNLNGEYVVQKVASHRLPECYVTYQTATGETFTVPSPHTPLNWSSAMLKLALGLLQPR
jgi:hypothetical protein